MARIRLVETEEDVETYRPVLDAIGDRQAELAVHEDDGLSVSVHCQTPLALSGGGNFHRGRFSFLPPPH